MTPLSPLLTYRQPPSILAQLGMSPAGIRPLATLSACVLTVLFNDAHYRNTTTNKGCANATVYICVDDYCLLPACYSACRFSKEDKPPCEVPWCMVLIERKCHVVCGMYGAWYSDRKYAGCTVVIDGALLLIAAYNPIPQTQTQVSIWLRFESWNLKTSSFSKRMIDLIKELGRVRDKNRWLVENRHHLVPSNDNSNNCPVQVHYYVNLEYSLRPKRSFHDDS